MGVGFRDLPARPSSGPPVYLESFISRCPHLNLQSKSVLSKEEVAAEMRHGVSSKAASETGDGWVLALGQREFMCLAGVAHEASVTRAVPILPIISVSHRGPHFSAE